MRYFDLYGTRTMTIDELRRDVESRLGVMFETRYSDEIGAYVRARGDNKERFSIEPNFEDERDEEDLQEPEFADRPVLLYVSRTVRGDEIRDLLLEIPGLEHLRRDTRD